MPLKDYLATLQPLLAETPFVTSTTLNYEERPPRDFLKTRISIKLLSRSREIWRRLLSEVVILEYFPQRNISSENIDILLFFSYIQLTPKNSHRKKLTAGIVAKIDC